MKRLIILFLIIGMLSFMVFDSGVNFPAKLETVGINWTIIAEDVSQVAMMVKQSTASLINIMFGKDKEVEEDIARYDAGEMHLEGEIKKISDNPRAIHIKLHMSDINDKVDNPIEIASRAVFKIKEDKATFRSLQIGDIVGIIINPQGKARKITVYNRPQQ
ncbi:hypothetical protein [Acetohalobium arabaticum]|uniref:Uncharacterized protein n=1 Tax=Acetohalobium arabaticum (strain ATCC 49924 / DSM 5501 / Z-7288) TaxID=574087 RepID=D9QU92_ACEAZ|nr:hypothetical protein [Acetohalobium arabaticum]ADL11885.1 hypothetical protein Acear_0338 [Acetohalobium arabaticum DSM 5501]